MLFLVSRNLILQNVAISHISFPIFMITHKKRAFAENAKIDMYS